MLIKIIRNMEHVNVHIHRILLMLDGKLQTLKTLFLKKDNLCSPCFITFKNYSRFLYNFKNHTSFDNSQRISLKQVQIFDEK